MAKKATKSGARSALLAKKTVKRPAKAAPARKRGRPVKRK
jgi:hypothetical protein